MSSNVSLVAGVVIERVGDDLMVMVPGNSDVVSLSGRPAEVLSDVEAGRKVDSTDPALRDLVDLGIVSAPGLSRRGLIKAGAIVVGAGVATLALPTAAYAASASYVEITGEWGPPSPTSATFTNATIDWPNGLGSSPGGTDPSVLTIVSLSGAATPFTVPLTSYDATGGAGADSVVWTYSGDFRTFSGRDAVGTFSWGEVNYRITFTALNPG